MVQTPGVFSAVKTVLPDSSRKVSSTLPISGVMLNGGAGKIFTAGYKGAYQAHHLVEQQWLKVLGHNVDAATTVILTQTRHAEISTLLAEANDVLFQKLWKEGRDAPSRGDLLRMYRDVYSKHAPESMGEVERALK